MLGSEHSHSFDVLVCDVGGDDQDGGIGVTQVIGAVNLTDDPALIRETLTKHIQPQGRSHQKTVETMSDKYIQYNIAICYTCNIIIFQLYSSLSCPN